MTVGCDYSDYIMRDRYNHTKVFDILDDSFPFDDGNYSSSIPRRGM